MGNQGKIAKKQSGKMYMHLSSYFHSEIHFREETNTVSRENPFLYLLAFLSRLSGALAYLPE